MKIKIGIASLLLTLALLATLSVPAAAAESAAGTALRLTKTEGTVGISKSNGKTVSLRDDMRLYNGYHVATEKESYAWINLDDTKLIKEDASSEAEVRKNGKKLEINISSGGVFFDVSEALEEDETLNISTSTMVVGIRGTSGWVRVVDRWQVQVCIIEGESQCVVVDPVTGEMKTATLRSGDMAECVVYPQDRKGDKCDILMGRSTVEDIPGFVLTELVRNVELCDRIVEKSGIDVLAELAKAAGGDPSGRTSDGKSATAEVLGKAEQKQGEDEAEAGRRLEEIQKELDGQENNISKDPVWVRDRQDGQTQRSTVPDILDDRGGSPDSEPSASDDSTVPDNPLPSTPSYTVTLDYNNIPDVSGPASVVTDATGKAALPVLTYTNNKGNLAFLGWFTEQTGGEQVTSSTVFTSSQTVYACWSGWDLRTDGMLIVADDSSMTSKPWAANGTDIMSAFILPGVTSIEREAFTYCGSLTSVTIPASVTSIGVSAFEGCDGLTSVTIPASVTSISNFAFSNCGSLTNVTIPASVTSIERETFSYCSSLTSITIPASVTSIGISAFESCNNLTSITIPNSVIDIAHDAFSYCSSLTSITIPASVTLIGASAFSNCSSLTNVTIPDSVIDIASGAFGYCDNLIDITIPASMTSINANMFYCCSSLTNVTIPASVTSIGNYAFLDCNALSSITFKGTTSDWSILMSNSPNANIKNGVTVTCTDGSTTT